MNANNVIAAYDAISAQIEKLKAEQKSLPRAVRPWGDHYRNFLGGDTAAVVEQIGGRWIWRAWPDFGYEFATPDTMEGARANADAHLKSNGVLCTEDQTDQGETE